MGFASGGREQKMGRRWINPLPERKDAHERAAILGRDQGKGEVAEA